MGTATADMMEALTQQLLKAAAEYAGTLLGSHKEEPCPGTSCDCHTVCGSVNVEKKNELLAQLQAVAPAVAALPTAEEQQLWESQMAQIQLMCFETLAPVLTEGFRLLLSGGHSAEAICSLADVYNRCSRVLLVASHTNTCIWSSLVAASRGDNHSFASALLHATDIEHSKYVVVL
jgi:hypothetical protein